MGFKQICIYIYNYMNKNIELFKISTYYLKRVNYVKSFYTENEIKDELINDHSYHIQYKDTDDVIIFFDLDHVNDENQFNSIIKIITDYFDIDNDEISYTKSIKTDELSYHISIPKYLLNNGYIILKLSIIFFISLHLI